MSDATESNIIDVSDAAEPIGEEAAAERPAEDGEPEELSLPAEFILFLRENKKWWLLPILLMIALIGLLLALGGTALAPFIYTFV